MRPIETWRPSSPSARPALPHGHPEGRPLRKRGPSREHASLEVPSNESIVSRSARASLVQRAVSPGPVSMPVCDRSRGYRSDRPLGRNSIQVHSPAESPPQSSFASPPTSWLSPTHEPTEVSALIAASPGASTCRERSPSPATFRPQAFSASRRFAPRFGFAGLFHPTSHVQGSSPSRGFSLRIAVLGLPSPLPPCRWPPPAAVPQPLPDETLPRRAGLDFEALLHAE